MRDRVPRENCFFLSPILPRNIAHLMITLLFGTIAYGDGVTIITHGFNPSIASSPGWLSSLRDDIAANHLGGEQLYGTITVTGQTVTEAAPPVRTRQTFLAVFSQASGFPAASTARKSRTFRA